MTDEEENKQLSDHLTKHGLHWLVLEVAEDIRAGKFALSKRRTIRENVPAKGISRPLARAPQYSSGPNEEFTVPEAYSPREQLILLLEAIRRALADPILMEQSIASVSDQPISFVNEEGKESVTLSSQGRHARSARASELRVEIENRLRELRTS